MATRKPRSDSKLDNLPELQLLELRDGLLSGWKYDEALSWLSTDCGVESSLSALSTFFKRHCSPVMRDRRQIAALKAETLVEEAGKTDWSAATLELVKQVSFEMLSREDFDPKTVERFLKVVLKAEAQDVDERKLALLEAKAAEAKDKLDAITNKAKSKGGLTEETLKQIEEAAGLL